MKIWIRLLLLLLMPGATLEDAIRLYEKGEYKQAVTALAQLKSTSPDDPDVRLWLGKAYLKTRDWDASVRELEQAVQLQPSAKNHLWLGRAYGGKASHVTFFSAPGWARRVLKEFEIARKLAPEDLDVRFDLLEYYLEAPGFLGGGKDKASNEAQFIAKQDPRRGYLARSTILSKDKKWDLVKKELIQATIQFPNDAAAFKDLADFLLGRQDYRGALQAAKRALALDGALKGGWLVAAAASVLLRTDLDESERILRGLASGPLTDEDPAFEDVYYWLGECYLAKDDKTRAQEAFRKALVFKPDHGKAKAKM